MNVKVMTLLIFYASIIMGCTTTCETCDLEWHPDSHIDFHGHAIQPFVLPKALPIALALDEDYSRSGSRTGLGNEGKVDYDRLLIYNQNRDEYISILAQQEQNGFYRGKSDLDVLVKRFNNPIKTHGDWSILELDAPAENRWTCVKQVDRWGDVMVVMTTSFNYDHVMMVLDSFYIELPPK